MPFKTFAALAVLAAATVPPAAAHPGADHRHEAPRVQADAAATRAPPSGESGGPTIEVQHRVAGSPPAEASALPAVPEPGTVQVFGIGLVILATVTATWRRSGGESVHESS